MIYLINVILVTEENSSNEITQNEIEKDFNCRSFDGGKRMNGLRIWQGNNFARERGNACKHYKLYDGRRCGGAYQNADGRKRRNFEG